MPYHAACCSETGCIPLSHTRRSLGQNASNHQHNPQKQGCQCPSKPHSSPLSEPAGEPHQHRGTHSRDSAWLFWKRSSGRVCSWLRFSRLWGRRKGSGFWGQGSPASSSGHSWGLWLSQRDYYSRASHLARTPLSCSQHWGNQWGINRLPHNVVITCRQDSKLLTADCCLTALLTCWSLSSSHLLRVF